LIVGKGGMGSIGEIAINDKGSVWPEDVNSDDVVNEGEVTDSRVVIETEAPIGRKEGIRNRRY